MFQRTLLVALLVVAFVVDGFFALVNFYPVAPTRARAPTRYVYTELDPVQAAWFQHHVLDEFNQEHNVDLHVRTLPVERIPEALAAERAHGNAAVLAVLPMEAAVEGVAHHAFRPFDEAIPASRIHEDFAAIRDQLMTGAQMQRRQYFLPRQAVLDVAVFRVSRVRDAEAHWRLLRPQIEAALREVNHHGLPTGYVLEHSPERWDLYDLFVLAYYWSHRSYDGQPARPRIAHRTGIGRDGQIDLAAALYRQGLTDATNAQYDSQVVRDYFGWETLFHRQGLYAPEMYDDDGLEDEDVLAGIEQDAIYLTTLDQHEAFTLHGGGHRGAPPHLADPDDLRFFVMPTSVSIDLDAHGLPARRGVPFSFREEMVWALPAGAPDASVAYDLVSFVMSDAVQQRECEALGSLPIRRDTIAARASIFRVPWMADVFEAGLAQWGQSELVPPSLIDGGPASVYAQLWDQLVKHGDESVPAETRIAAALGAPPSAMSIDDRDEGPLPAAWSPPPASSDDLGGDNDVPREIDPDNWRQRVVIENPDASHGDAGSPDDAGTTADAAVEGGAR